MTANVIYSDSMSSSLRRRNTRENNLVNTAGLRKGPLLESPHDAFDQEGKHFDSKRGVFSSVQQAGTGGIFRTVSEPAPANEKSPDSSSASNSSTGVLGHYNSLSSMWSKVNAHLPDFGWSSSATTTTTTTTDSRDLKPSATTAADAAASNPVIDILLPRSSSSSSDGTRLDDLFTHSDLTTSPRTDLTMSSERVITSSEKQGTTGDNSQWTESETVYLYTPTAAAAATGGAGSTRKAGLVHRNNKGASKRD